MEWIHLLIAGLFEVSWAIGLKFSNGFTQPFVSVFTVICMIASFYFLALALKKIDQNISNLLFLRLDASNIEDVFDREITTIYLNFSDPWPKKRHAKRRWY